MISIQLSILFTRLKKINEDSSQLFGTIILVVAYYTPQTYLQVVFSIPNH